MEEQKTPEKTPDKTPDKTPEKKLRLFFAIVLPGEIMMKLSKLKTLIPELMNRDFSNLHVTLSFLGETPERLVPDIKRAVKNELFKHAGKTPPFKLKVKSLSVFKKFPPTPLVLRVEESKALSDLKLILDRGLASVNGVSMKLQKYQPHITLARLKNPFSMNLKKLLKYGKMDSCL
jgi:2'-5' RNA ligase